MGGESPVRVAIVITNGKVASGKKLAADLKSKNVKIFVIKVGESSPDDTALVEVASSASHVIRVNDFSDFEGLRLAEADLVTKLQQELMTEEEKQDVFLDCWKASWRKGWTALHFLASNPSNRSSEASDVAESTVTQKNKATTRFVRQSLIKEILAALTSYMQRGRNLQDLKNHVHIRKEDVLNVATSFDDSCKTPLHVSAESGNLEVAEFFLGKIKTKMTRRASKVNPNFGKSPTLPTVSGRVTRVDVFGEPDETESHPHKSLDEFSTVRASHDRFLNTLEHFLPMSDSLHDEMKETSFQLTLQEKTQVLTVNTKDGKNMLHLTLERGHTSVALFIMDQAVECGVRQLLKNETKAGNTPIHTASLWDNFTIVEKLAGKLTEEELLLNLKKMNKRSQTPLDMSKPDSKVFRLLMEYYTTNFTEDDMKDNDTGDTPLHRAVRSGDNDVIDKYMAHGFFDINSTNYKEETPLHLAVRQSSTAAVDTIMGYNADLEKRDSDGNTPLLVALKGKDFMMAALLLKYGADENAKDEDGNTAVSLMSFSDDPYLIKSLFEINANILIQNPDTKNTSLIDSAFYGNSHTLRQLLKSEPETISEVHDKQQPFNWMMRLDSDEFREPAPIYCIHPEKIQFIYKCQASVKETKYQPCLYTTCPLIKKEDNYFVHIAHVLNHQQQSVLHVACEHCDANIVDEILDTPECQSLINVQDQDGNTALHLAARRGILDIVDCLLDHQADLSLANKDWETPLHIAAKRGRGKVIKLLLNKRPFKEEVNERDQNSSNKTKDKMKEQLQYMSPSEKRRREESEKIKADIIRKITGISMEDIPEEPQIENLETMYNEWKRLITCQNKDRYTAMALAVKYEKKGAALAMLESDDHRLFLYDFIPDPQEDPGYDDTGEELHAGIPIFTALVQDMPDVAKEALDKSMIQDEKKEKKASVRKQSVWGVNGNYAAEKKNYSRVDMKKQKSARRQVDKQDLWKPKVKIDIRLLHGKVPDLWKPYREEINDITIEVDSSASKYAFMNGALKPDDPESVLPEQPNNTGTQVKVSPNQIRKEKLAKFNKIAKKDQWEKPWDMFADQAMCGDVSCNCLSCIAGKNTPNPCIVMHQYDQEELLDHPVTRMYVHYMWTGVASLYYAYVAFYLAFLSVLTNFAVEATPPYHRDESSCEVFQASSLRQRQQAVQFLAIVGLISECFQFLSKPLKYLFDPVNILTLFVFTSALVVMLPMQEDCYLPNEWQWQVLVFTCLFCWYNLILCVRRLPYFGIYPAMAVQVTFTLFKASFMFVLYLIAFAVSFTLLFEARVEFSDLGKGLMKTWVMMIGEMDFTDMFHPDGTEESSLLPYRTASTILFAFFLVLMGIVLLNLLTGLAVDDVNAIRKKSAIDQQHMQLQFALQIQQARLVPKPLIRALLGRQFLVIYPNFPYKRLKKWLLSTFDGYAWIEKETKKYIMEIVTTKDKESFETQTLNLLEKQDRVLKMQHQKILDVQGLSYHMRYEIDDVLRKAKTAAK